MRELMIARMKEAFTAESGRWSGFAESLGWTEKRPKHTPRADFVAISFLDFLRFYNWEGLSDEELLDKFYLTVYHQTRWR
jgi:hypothetical protein